MSKIKIKDIMPKSLHLILFILITNSILFAQDDEYMTYIDPAPIQNKVDNFFPPGPDASSLGKYAEIPINTYTGVPNISIPLYTIEGRHLTLPISLSYHSSGIKVDEEASWVGAGWSLNAGGCITRVVRGIPDDVFHIDDGIRYSENRYGGGYTKGGVDNAGYFYGSHIESLFDKEILEEEDYRTISAIGRGAIDGEPDMFYYNFAGYTGKFVYDQNKNVYLLPKQKLKIEFYYEQDRNPDDDDLGLIGSFVVTVEDGTKYTFAAAELMKNYSLSSNVIEPPDLTPQAYNSAWYLTKIESPVSNEVIYFTYESEDIARLNRIDRIVNGQESYDVASEDIIKTKRLKQITWEGGYIDFVANTIRKDIDKGGVFNSSNIMDSKALDRISIYRESDSEPIKSFCFNYDYFSFSYDEESFLTKTPAYLKLKLLSIQEKGEDQALHPPYTFDYYQHNFTNDIAIDFWGYYTDQNVNTGVPSIFVYEDDNNFINTYQTKYSIYQRPHVGSELYLNGDNREPDALAMQHCILKRINYPTGGYSRFVYEPHTFYFDGVLKFGGGLRIDSNIHSDGITEQIKEYLYEDIDGNSSGRIISFPNFANYAACKNNDCPSFETRLDSYNYHTQIHSRKLGGLGSTHGSNVGYKSVTMNTDGIGKIVYEYSLPVDITISKFDCDVNNTNCIYNRTTILKTPRIFSGYVDSGQPTVDYFYKNAIRNNPNYDWNSGKLEIEKYYDKDNNLVKEITYDYNENREIQYDIVKAISSKTLSFFEDYRGPSATYSFAKYYYISAWKYPTKKVEILYDKDAQVNNLSSTVEYFYDNPEHLQLTRTKYTNSDGKVYYQQNKYPADYDFTNSTIDNLGQGAYALYKMQDALHMHSIPVESISWEYISETQKNILSGNITLFSEFETNQFLPYEAKSIETDEPILNFENSSITSNRFEYDDRFKKQEGYKYHSNANIIEKTITNKPTEAYLWDSKQTYPIAMALNANIENIAYTSFENSESEGNWSISTSNYIDSEDSKSGKVHFKLTGRDLALETAFAQGKYVLSFWATNDVLVTGVSVIESKLVEISYNGWKLYEKLVEGSGSLYIEASTNPTYIDELRFYPADAKMTTYTYNPLIGVTSTTDENNTTAKFEYDELGRLSVTKNSENEIVDIVEYNYRRTADFMYETPVYYKTPIQFSPIYVNQDATYSWSFGDEGTSNEMNPTYTFNNLGTISVLLTITFNDVSTTATEDIEVKFIPIYSNITKSNIDVCPGTHTFNVNVEDGSDNFSYEWSVDGVARECTTNVFSEYFDTGYYDIACIVTDLDDSNKKYKSVYNLYIGEPGVCEDFWNNTSSSGQTCLTSDCPQGYDFCGYGTPNIQCASIYNDGVTYIDLENNSTVYIYNAQVDKWFHE